MIVKTAKPASLETRGLFFACFPDQRNKITATMENKPVATEPKANPAMNARSSALLMLEYSLSILKTPADNEFAVTLNHLAACRVLRKAPDDVIHVQRLFFVHLKSPFAKWM